MTAYKLIAINKVGASGCGFSLQLFFFYEEGYWTLLPDWAGNLVPIWQRRLLIHRLVTVNNEERERAALRAHWPRGGEARPHGGEARPHGGEAGPHGSAPSPFFDSLFSAG